MATAGGDASYIVRVWSGPTGFRAHVRDVRCERGTDFTDAGALASFFAAVRVPDADLSPPADQPDWEGA